MVILREYYGNLWVVFENISESGLKTFSAYKLTTNSGRSRHFIEGINSVKEIEQLIDENDERMKEFGPVYPNK